MIMPPCPLGEWGLWVIGWMPHCDNGWMVKTRWKIPMNEGKKILISLWGKDTSSWKILKISSWTEMSRGKIAKMFTMFPSDKTLCIKIGIWRGWVGASETKVFKHKEISPRLGRNKEQWWASFQGVSSRDITLVILSSVGNVSFKGSKESQEPSQGDCEYASRCMLILTHLLEVATKSKTTAW